MKALVTGSSGHLGEALVRTLIEAGHDVVALDIKPSPFTTLTGSICDTALVAECMKGVDTVFHAATLHKPHVGTHSKTDFITTNIQGTLTLLEAAVRAGVKSFVYTSTTSVFGDALRPAASEPAAWVTEETLPIPRNIYGVTKEAAENLCQLFQRKEGLPTIALRTSRFFPEEDDEKEKRDGFAGENLKVNELLYRRVDIEDVVQAHLLAAAKAPEIGFARYIISAPTPFKQNETARLRNDLPTVLRERFSSYESIYRKYGWKMLQGIDRVYISDAAKRDLGWTPKYDFPYALDCLARSVEPRSELAAKVGIKGYHDQAFTDGPYPL